MCLYGPTADAQPVEPVHVTSEGTWAFEPGADPFSDDALLDLRHLNEKNAGEHGFIRLSDDGESFVRGDGKPVRFWAVCSYGYRLKPDEMKAHTRLLAKLGVNMVRLHTNIAGTKEGQRITDVNQQEIDNIWRFIAACRDEGIYVTLSPYWYHHKLPASWLTDLEGYKAGDMATGALFFNEGYQRAYKGWVRQLLTTPNPYTGVALKDDPTVAILQIKNEDSLLFWTFDRLPEAQKRILGKQFGDWAAKEYGSVDKALETWGHAVKGDDAAAGVLGFEITWFFTQPVKGGRAARLRDQLRFLAWRQHRFFADIHSYLTDELGCKQLTNAMNWKSADKLALDDVERWTYTACDVMAVNRYAGGVHRGTNDGYRIDPGHFVQNRSMLLNPLQIPTNLKQTAGRPMLITESTWVNPNRYQAEGPMLVAAYLSLSGVDGFYWFADGEMDYVDDPRRKWWPVVKGETGYALLKWTTAIQPIKGLFPANALLYRRGDLKQGAVVVDEHRAMDSLWDRKPPIIAETETFDPNRDTVDLRDQADGRSEVSRLAFLVGPVRTTADSDPKRTRVADLSSHIDGRQQRVRSNTGELELDYAKGLLRMDSPRAQGVAGFLKDAGGRFELSSVTIESDNDYAAVQLVSLDDQPLARSSRVLVQVGTTAALEGWRTEATTLRDEKAKTELKGERIVATGKPPYRVADTQVTLTVINAALTKATKLTPYGYAAGEVALERAGSAVRLTLPADTMYLILSR